MQLRLAQSTTEAHQGLAAPSEPEGEAIGLRKQTVVDSPEFQRWFEGSKIKHWKDGPLVVYHGSDHGFESFEEGNENGWSIPRPGHYFTDDLEMASEFGTVKPFFLCLRNPADFAPFLPESMEKDRRGELLDRILEHMAEADLAPYLRPSHFTDEPVRLSHGTCASRGLLQTKPFLEAAKRAGFDGLILDDQLGGARGFTSFVAFDPRQIKSADENCGVFDPNNPNYRS